MDAISVFQHLVPLFQKAGFQIYMVGGSARDYVLHRPFDDLDVATDAPPEALKLLFPDANDRFAKYGNLHFMMGDIHVDLTTLRKESDYIDARHPSKITFIDDISIDAKRRDFTMNALYIDASMHVHDFFGGIADIHAKVIRMIGRPVERLKEDPLRMIRALRFQAILGFTLDSELEKAMIECAPLLKKLRNEKIKQELQKLSKLHQKLSLDALEKYHIHLD